MSENAEFPTQFYNIRLLWSTIIGRPGHTVLAGKLLFDSVQQAAQDIDLVAFELGASEQSAELGQQSPRALWIEEAAAHHHPPKMVVEALDVLIGCRWRGEGNRRS